MILNTNEINAIDDINVLTKEYTDLICHYSCIPDKAVFPYPKLGEVIDEDKSVRWNKDEVDKLREAYENEKKRLTLLKTKCDNAYEIKLITLLSDENDLSLAKAKCIYAYAYRESHDSGVGNVISTFRELADLVSDLDKCEEAEINHIEDEELSR